MNIEFIEYIPTEPTVEEIKKEEEYWKNRRYFCPYCKNSQTFFRCPNCGKMFCSEHCYWDNDGTWEYPAPDYPVCYHCDKE